MKKIFLFLFLLLFCTSELNAAYQQINDGEGGASVRGKMNSMHNELYNPTKTEYTPTTEPTHGEGNVYYDTDAKTLSVQNDITGSSLQLGRENWSRSCNNTGVTLSNGSVVYISGIDTDCPEVTLAQPDEFVKSRIIGVVTNEILNSAQGEVTSYGRVRNINTSSLTAGMPCYLDTDGTMTSTSPTGSDYTVIVGVCLVSNATTGSIFVNPYVSEVTVDVTDTNGFPNRTETAISFNDTTRTFSIAPTDTAFYYYIDGKSVKRTTTDNIIIDNSEGLHVIYYDDNAGTLATVLNPTPAQQDVVIRTKVIISYVYWDAENSKSIYLPDERHGISMSPQTHSYLHFTQGAKYLSGLALTDVLSDQTGDVNTHAQFGILTGVITDEDIITVPPTILSTVGLPIYYLDSANVYSRQTTNSGFSVLDDITAGVGTTGRLVYNEWTGTTWQLSTVGNNDFVLCHIFATNDSDSSRRSIAVIGQGDYGTIGQARAGATTEISNILTRFPQEEFVPIATVIFQTSDGYSNDVKARIRTDDEGADYVDWRTTELAQGVTPSDHNNLTGLELATDGTTWGHIDDQTQTIYGDKTFDGNTTIGSLTNLIFTDGSETVTTDPFSFSANHSLRLVDGDMVIPSEDLIDTDGLLESTGVTLGSYTNANITVGADGRLTAASNGSGGTGDLSYSEGTTDPTSSSTADTFYGNTSDGGFFFKSDTGIFDIVAGTYTADPVLYTLTVTDPGNNDYIQSTDGFIDCGNSATDCTYNYASGSTPELTATAASGRQFDNWTGDLSGSTNPITLSAMSSAVSVSGAFSENVDAYVGFPNDATDNNPTTPDEISNVTEDFAWFRDTPTGLTGTAKRIRVYYTSNIGGTNHDVLFYKDGSLVASASITPVANSWVWSDALTAESGYSSSDLVFNSTTETVQFGHTVETTTSFDVTRDDDATGSYYYGPADTYKPSSTTSFTSFGKDLSCILEYE